MPNCGNPNNFPLASSRSSSYHATPSLCMATKAPTTTIPCPMSGPSAQRAKTKWWRCRYNTRILGYFSVDKIIVANSGIYCAFQGVRTPILQLSAMQEGDYTFQLTVTDSAGQQDTSQVTVIVQPGKQLESSCHLSRYHFPAITDVTH